MPDTGKNAVQHWDGTGSQTVFVISFTYLHKDHIEVAVSTDGGSSWNVQARTAAWDFVGSGATPGAIQFVTPPAGASQNVRITRVTTHPTPVVDFENHALVTAENLDSVIRQCIYYSEEVEDKI